MWLDSRVKLNPLCKLFMFMFVSHDWSLSNAAHFNINAPSIISIFDRVRRPETRKTKDHERFTTGLMLILILVDKFSSIYWIYRFCPSNWIMCLSCLSPLIIYLLLLFLYWFQLLPIVWLYNFFCLNRFRKIRYNIFDLEFNDKLCLDLAQ